MCRGWCRTRPPYTEESFGHECADFYFVLFPHVCFDHFCLGANMDATSQMHRGVDLVRDMLISLAVGLELATLYVV